MLVFTCSDFELDLSHYSVTFNESNSWFDEDLSSQFSFPIETTIEDWKFVTDFKSFNTYGQKRNFSGDLNHQGILSKAVLKIHQVKGNNVSCIIYVDLGVLSKLDIPLKSIPLHDFTVPDIRNHAQGIIGKQYPDVDYNFPIVYTDKYKDDSTLFKFENAINNYQSGSFLTNIIDEENGDQIRNIMQPLPYVMYVLKAGFEYLGFKIKGDILSDGDLNKMLLFRDAEYFVKLSKETINLSISVDQYLSKGTVNNLSHSVYFKQYVIGKKGKYALNGNFTNVLLGAAGFFNSRLTEISISILLSQNGTLTTLYSFDRGVQTYYPPGAPYNVLTSNVDIDLELELEEGAVISINKREVSRDGASSVTPDYPETVSLNLYPIRYKNPDGTPIISVLDVNAVSLSRTVPDVSLLELFNAIRKWKNYSVDISGTEISLYSISSKLDRSTALDLSDYEVQDPLRTFSEQRSFELMFADGDSNSSYPYDKLYITEDGISTNTYTKASEASSINIEALPLPVINRALGSSAFALDDDTGKIRVVFYRAVPEGGKPLTYENAGMLIPAVYNNFYKGWLQFRVNSVAFEWSIRLPGYLARDLVSQSLVYAYGQYHVVKQLEKARQNLQYYDITVQSESLI